MLTNPGGDAQGRRSHLRRNERQSLRDLFGCSGPRLPFSRNPRYRRQAALMLLPFPEKRSGLHHKLLWHRAPAPRIPRFSLFFATPIRPEARAQLRAHALPRLFGPDAQFKRTRSPLPGYMSGTSAQRPKAEAKSVCRNAALSVRFKETNWKA
jgi:hypothetical protein